MEGGRLGANSPSIGWDEGPSVRIIPIPSQTSPKPSAELLQTGQRRCVKQAMAPAQTMTTNGSRPGGHARTEKTPTIVAATGLILKAATRPAGGCVAGRG